MWIMVCVRELLLATRSLRSSKSGGRGRHPRIFLKLLEVEVRRKTTKHMKTHIQPIRSPFYSQEWGGKIGGD